VRPFVEGEITPLMTGRGPHRAHLVGSIKMDPPVDGRHPAAVEVGSLSHYSQGSIHPRWLAGFLNHQRYWKDGFPNKDG